ncbi:MAG: hypothetical protein KKH01_07005 [Firmicutes bacterium]|nr:hypothetical protein [Bacillota bacterium]
MKMLKRLLIFILVIVIVIVGGLFFFVKSIAVEVTDSDLPQDVYTENGDLLVVAQNDLLELFLADEADRYTIFEEFLNLVILDSIQTNINTAYDPLGTLDTNEANYIVYETNYYIDYVYAELNDTNQMVVCVSFGSDRILTMHSAIYLTFDIDIQIEPLNVSVVLTLVEYRIADQNLSFKILDYIFTKLDKASIEDSITYGVLDLDLYTFTVSMLD